MYILPRLPLFNRATVFLLTLQSYFLILRRQNSLITTYGSRFALFNPSVLSTHYSVVSPHPALLSSVCICPSRSAVVCACLKLKHFRLIQCKYLLFKLVILSLNNSNNTSQFIKFKTGLCLTFHIYGFRMLALGGRRLKGESGIISVKVVSWKSNLPIIAR